MSMRWIVIAIVVGVAALAYVAWNGNQQRPQPAAPPTAGSEMPPAGGGGMPPSGGGGMPAVQAADPDLAWRTPKGWTDEGPRSMRLATYAIPGQAGADAAECAVYYFGPGQGGGVEENLARWAGEFEGEAKPERTSREVGGLKVSRVRVKGAYVAHAGSSMGGGAPQGSLPDHELLAAIVEGPSGSVFFKLTGPRATVDAAAADFDRMLGSLKKK